MNFKNLILPVAACLVYSISFAQTIPLDPSVRTGKLSNGFTYYIRNNNEPQKRVQLYLVNKVGSILEDEDQRGLAHFMEHMNFNGTKNFPKNELVDYLQKSGVKFGADLNAYTSFNETVYELPLPSDDPAMVSNGIKIMRDWAQEALLDSTEIEKERGVVLEEERLGKGAQERMARKYYPVLLNHSHYADRIPIGRDSILINFKPATIRRFHQDWYRPDLQALIVVGDIDVNETEKTIKARFSDLKNPVNERPRTVYSIPLTGQNQFLAVTDKEQPAINLNIFFKHRVREIKTNQDYLAAIKRGLFNQMFAARQYAVNTQQKNPAYVNMSAGIQPLLADLDVFVFEVTPKEGQIKSSFEQAWAIIENVQRFGFTQTELEHAKQNYLSSVENSASEKDKTPSSSFVNEYKSHFLNGDASPGIQWELQFTKDNLPGITLSDINSVSKEYIKDENRDILIYEPEKDKSILPDSATVTSWLEQMKNTNPEPFKDDQAVLSLLPVKPKVSKVISKSYQAKLNLTTLVLSNGIKIILKPTDFKNNEIKYTGFASGGTSLYTDADFDNASISSAFMSQFGLGNLNPVQLTKAVNGKLVHSSARIENRFEIINGDATAGDLETALQLTYLQFTKPRKDSLLFSNILNTIKENLANRGAEPKNVFTDTINYVMSNYNYRFAPASLERINRLDLQKAYDIYKERFSDASGFTFVFVGNFTPEGIAPLLVQYLGALPALNKKEQARDLGIHIPTGQMVKKVFKGTENKALVRLVFSGDNQYNAINDLLLRALGEVLQIKLLQHLREDEGEVYSPSVQTAYNKFPKSRYAVTVTFGCAPKNVDHLIDMVKKEMNLIIANGPEPDDLQKFKASYVKKVEEALKDNSFWVGYLSGQLQNGEALTQVLETAKLLSMVTPSSLKTAASIFLSDKNMISFELLPEKDSVN